MTVLRSLCNAPHAQGSAKPIRIKLHCLKFILVITNFVRDLSVEIKEEKRMSEVILCISSTAQKMSFFFPNSVTNKYPGGQVLSHFQAADAVECSGGEGTMVGCNRKTHQLQGRSSKTTPRSRGRRPLLSLIFPTCESGLLFVS